MTALSKARDTVRCSAHAFPERFTLPVAAATIIYQGSIVCKNSSGYAVPASTSTSLVAVGRAEKTIDNSAGSAGDLNVDVSTGVYKFANSSAGDAITIAERFKVVYLVDDQTVAKTSNSGARSIAGQVMAVDSSGVEVRFFPVDNLLSTLATTAPGMQAVNATISSGTVTINTGIVVASNSEVVPLVIGALTGSTNFASLGELKASRVNGAAGVGTVVIQAWTDGGVLDSDATGAIRVLIFTPQ